MHKLFALCRKLGIVLSIIALSACGGGGGGSPAPFGGTGSGAGSGSGGTGTTVVNGTPVASIDVIGSASVLGTGASDTVTITAIAKSSGNAGIASAPVTFSTDSGVLTASATVTDASGTATAILAAGSNKATRTIKVTVTSGSITGSVSIPVVSIIPAVIDVVATASRVGTGAPPITITAVVKASNNVALANAPIQFSSDTGNLVSNATLTNANGSATASFSPGADKSNRSATIKVASGSVVGEIKIVIDGSTLTVAGPETLKAGDKSQVSDLSFKATDSTGSPISGLSLALRGTLSNIPAGISIVTDTVGSAKYTYIPAVSGSDVVTATGAGTSVSSKINVSGQDFAFVTPAPSATINVDTSGLIGQNVVVRYLLNGQAPVAGIYKVRFTSTAGSFIPVAAASAGLDLVAGQASVVISSRFAGPGTLQATLFDPAAPNTSIALASIPIQFVATTPANLVLQISPSAIAPNLAGATTQQAEARATVLDGASNPVAGVVVNFSRTSDPSGGNLLQASATTDSNGVARVQYSSGAQSTQTDGVSLQATVATNPAIFGRANLTVNQSALFIALGQGNQISNVNETTYRKQWTAYVTDSTGAPVSNVILTISALPTKYGKGTYVWSDEAAAWVSGIYLQSAVNPDGVQDPAVDFSVFPIGTSIYCPSEDTLSTTAGFRNNGVLDPGEDKNTSGKLEPGNVISVNGGGSVTTVVTDGTGFALINLQYAESYAHWVEIALRVSANVAGTESSNTAVLMAPGLSSDYTVKEIFPAGVRSPFGVVASCSVAR